MTNAELGYIDRLERVLALAPMEWVIEYRGQTTTWGDISGIRKGLTRTLEDMEIPDNLSIGLIAQNRADSAMAAVALLMTGRSIILLNPLQPAAKLAREVAELNLAAIVSVPETVTPELRDAMHAAGTALIVVEGDTARADADLSAPGSKEKREADPSHAIEIQTSGTTGVPKRIALTRKTLESALRDGIRSETGKRLALKRSPTFLFVPIPHTSGIFALLLSIYEGRPVMLFDRFNIQEFRDALHRHRPKFVSLLPPVLRTILASDMTREEMSSLIAVRSGSAPLSPEDQQAFEDRFGVPVLTNYGATEFMGVLASWTIEEHRKFGRAKLGSVGRARRGVKFRIVDEMTGKPLDPGQRGVLEVEASSIGLEPGWTRTTDLARLDADGFLYVVGRADDAINRGGFKVMANQVADVLRQHPDVAEAVVIGIPDARLGELPVAAVELEPNATLDETQLKDWSRRELTSYQVPAQIVFVDKLPRTISMKVSRPDVKKLFEERINA